MNEDEAASDSEERIPLRQSLPEAHRGISEAQTSGLGAASATLAVRHRSRDTSPAARPAQPIRAAAMARGETRARNAQVIKLWEAFTSRYRSHRDGTPARANNAERTAWWTVKTEIRNTVRRCLQAELSHGEYRLWSYIEDRTLESSRLFWRISAREFQDGDLGPGTAENRRPFTCGTGMTDATIRESWKKLQAREYIQRLEIPGHGSALREFAYCPTPMWALEYWCAKAGLSYPATHADPLLIVAQVEAMDHAQRKADRKFYLPEFVTSDPGGA